MRFSPRLFTSSHLQAQAPLVPVARLALVTLTLSLITPSNAWANCQDHYEQALTILSATQKDIRENKHPSMEAFTQKFQGAIDAMKSNECHVEMVKLNKHIQDEQQKYPVATPIED